MDWVLQWDPPANASAFVHRVGRTARQGQEGCSLILLLENEESYVHFIEKNQRVKLISEPDTATQDNVTLTKYIFSICVFSLQLSFLGDCIDGPIEKHTKTRPSNYGKGHEGVRFTC